MILAETRHFFTTRDKRTGAGSVTEGNLGLLNRMIISCFGRKIRISSKDNVCSFVDPEVKKTIDRYMLDPNGNLRYHSFKSFVDSTTAKNISRRGPSITASINEAGNNLRFMLKAVTGDEFFLTRPFNEIVNCIEYATFVSVISKIYFPETKVRVFIFSNTKIQLRKIFKGTMKKIVDRHAYFIFIDKDGEVYLSIFGSGSVPVAQGIHLLQETYERSSGAYSHIPRLIDRILQEASALNNDN